MANRKIDVKVLINEIFLRPQLWDPKQKMLADKKTRKRTWEDLCTVFDEHYHERSTEKQIEMCQHLKRKFRTLRESYLREEKLQTYEKKCGKIKSKRRQYVYFDQLHFLSTSGGKTSARKRLMRNNLNTATQSLNEEQRAENEQILPTADTSPQANELDKSLPRVRKSLSHVPNITAQLPPPPSIDLDFTEPDTLFLLSLVNEMKKVAEDNKLTAKIDILQAIRRWQTSNECQSITNQNYDSISTVFSNFQEQEIHVFCCPICQNKFRTENAQQNHLESHVENGLYICSQCFIGFISIKELMFHMKSHNQKTPNHSGMFKQHCVSINGTVDSFDDTHKSEFVKLEYSDSDTNESLR